MYCIQKFPLQMTGLEFFNSIRQYADQQLHIKMDTAQARMELYKGKFTTSPESHSGEGIFFYFQDACAICLVVRRCDV